jgi:photosystem I subunit X
LITTTLMEIAPRATDWSPAVGLVMILSNVTAIAFAKMTMSKENQTAGPAMPSANMFGGFGAPAVVGATCFGHVIGAGVILGLSNMGVL